MSESIVQMLICSPCHHHWWHPQDVHREERAWCLLAQLGLAPSAWQQQGAERLCRELEQKGCQREVGLARRGVSERKDGDGN